ncbi:hypothetical protein CSHISOI_10763 [Colletotrichum shisoi]|uniref:Six-hairpin glycosidase-like protein n=1 Tax=Colletotrichum shisoi TaxID=2078593 RepID=A0A5Q4BCK8_9PEZI|nr:hypothetical protein CSHISOI_10763 [Colletotrichum shisoi]
MMMDSSPPAPDQPKTDFNEPSRQREAERLHGRAEADPRPQRLVRHPGSQAPGGLPQVSQWLIGNPNRLNLGRIGLKYKGQTLSAAQIGEPRQELDLWGGFIASTFKVDGETVTVVTRGDFASDAVTFTIESPLVSAGDLRAELDFPYPPIHTTEYKYEVFAGVYDFPRNHTTRISRSCGRPDLAHIHHELRETSYFVNLRWPSESPLELSRDEPEGSDKITAHRYTLAPSSGASNGTSNGTSDGTSGSFTFTAHFSPQRQDPRPPEDIQKESIAGWRDYRTEGGFVDLTLSSNPNATELQRRILLSQYHVRVNSAASGQSPQESGLMNNGWYGKFHMEMVVWHSAHWVTWGRKKYFDNIFPELYETLLPSSFARAKQMGWEGARWPKMTELESGRSSPGGVNGLLLWQQPHPMYLAELAYQSSPTDETLKRWDAVLTATADYMASYAWKNESSGYFDLGPPSYGVTENTPPAETLNLAYEVVNAQAHTLHSPGRHAHLVLAIRPRPRARVEEEAREARPGALDDPELNGDPRSLIMMQGVLPDTPAVDPAVALRTADKVWEVWTDQKIRGWGRPVLAINSARIGNPERAVHHLTAYTYWKFDDAGYAIRGGDGGTPPPFMPGNAGFLYAGKFFLSHQLVCEEVY